MYVRNHEEMTMFRVTPAACAGCSAERIGFCANLDAAAINQIAAISRSIRFKKFQNVSRRDTELPTAIVLRTGMVKISHTLTDGRQQIVDFLTDGDILLDHPRDNAQSTIVEATTDVDACEISLADLNALSVDAPELRDALLGAALEKIDRKNYQLMMLGRKRSDERVASFLLDFLERAKRRGKPSNRLNLPMSRGEIADYLSLTTETVSRAFSVLREEGILQLPKSYEVVVFDFARLEEIAEGGSNLSVR
jgi:CRP/FNR family transcriptional regulator